MPIPKYDELMKPLLLEVKDGKDYTVKQIRALLASRLNITADEMLEMLPSGRQKVFDNRVGWAKTYLIKAGLLNSPARGIVTITDAGRKVIAENPDKIDKNYLDRFESFKEFIDESTVKESEGTLRSTDTQTDLTPDDQLENAYNQINASLTSDLMSEILKISPYTFEKLVVDLLAKMGYGTLQYGSHATAASGDDGIDGIIMEDKLGFSLIYMQAKQWAVDKVVGQPEIQAFVGAIAGKHGDGLFVTTADFSQKAVDYADNHHIILINGKKLTSLMIEHNFCVSTRKTFDIKDIDTDMLAEYQDM